MINDANFVIWLWNLIFQSRWSMKLFMKSWDIGNFNLVGCHDIVTQHLTNPKNDFSNMVKIFLLHPVLALSDYHLFCTLQTTFNTGDRLAPIAWYHVHQGGYLQSLVHWWDKCINLFVHWIPKHNNNNAGNIIFVY